MLSGGVSSSDCFQSFRVSILTWRASKINDSVASLLVAQLLFLEAEESQKPIHLYVNSPGGSVTAGMAIYDTVSASSQSISHY